MILLSLTLLTACAERLVPVKVTIPTSLRTDCEAPDPRKAKGANELALNLERARLCEQGKRQAILAVVDALNALTETKK